MSKKYFSILFLLVFISACTSQKKLIYFQEASSSNSNLPGDTSTFELKVYPEDILSVQLLTINPEAMPGISSSFDKQIIDNRTAYEKGFVVDKNGDLDLPLIGKFHVAGLTLIQTKEVLISKFKNFVDDPVVILKKLSFKITILGEVTRPGLYYIPNEKMTFIEALGMAGDLTPYGDRTDIKIFRKGKGQQLQEIKVDLTKTDILQPSMRFVEQDDVIYVKPIKRKALANINPAVVVITSIISTTAIIISLIIRAND